VSFEIANKKGSKEYKDCEPAHNLFCCCDFRQKCDPANFGKLNGQVVSAWSPTLNDRLAVAVENLKYLETRNMEEHGGHGMFTLTKAQKKLSRE